MHDSVVRFYQLDVKMSSDCKQCECLMNLLTSLVMKSPVYSQVHSLFQAVHKKSHVKQVGKVMESLK